MNNSNTMNTSNRMSRTLPKTDRSTFAQENLEYWTNLLATLKGIESRLSWTGNWVVEYQIEAENGHYSSHTLSTSLIVGCWTHGEATQRQLTMATAVNDALNKGLDND